MFQEIEIQTNSAVLLLPVVNMVVITHKVLVAKPLLCSTVSLLEISKNLD